MSCLTLYRSYHDGYLEGERKPVHKVCQGSVPNTVEKCESNRPSLMGVSFTELFSLYCTCAMYIILSTDSISNDNICKLL